jgi:hypothetical protein
VEEETPGVLIVRIRENLDFGFSVLRTLTLNGGLLSQLKGESVLGGQGLLG